MRSEARIRCQVWQDPDFCALPRSAQGLYWMLLSQPDVTLAGALPFMPARWEMLAADDDVVRDLEVLERARFVLVDRRTHEVLIRTFVRHDGVLRSEKTRAGMWSAWHAIFSPALRRAFIDGLDQEVVTEATTREWVMPSTLKALPDGVSLSPRNGVSDGVSPRARADSTSDSTSVTNSSGAANATRDRNRDDLTIAVADACGVDWRNGLGKAARGALTAAVADLRSMGATPDQVPRRAGAYRRQYPEASLTPSALAKHWPALNATTSSSTTGSMPVVGSPEWEARQAEERERTERLAGDR